MFFAAFSSLLLELPHSHSHTLIRKSVLPLGLLEVISPQHEQIWVVNFSLTSSNNTPAFSHLYLSIVFSAENPVSKTDFAILVFTSLLALKSPTTISAFSFTSRVLALCKWSLRQLAILACNARTRFLFLAL